MRRTIMLGVLLVLIAAACTQDGAISQEPESSTTVSAAPTTTTTAATTTTTAATTAPATTTRLYEWGLPDDAHAYAYQSVGYSCGPDPTTGCEGDADMTLDEVILHKENDYTTVDCLDLLMKAHGDDVLLRAGYQHRADDEAFVGSGWGVRVVQLDAPPAGFEIGGEAWLELTVSSASATDFAARLPATPTSPVGEMARYPVNGMAKYSRPTDTDPVTISPPPKTANMVEELVLIGTTDDMMQWIIVLTDDQVYHHISGYGRVSDRTTLTIKINGGAAG